VTPGDFGLLNWSIVGAYLALMLWLGYRFSDQIDTDQDYYLGRRTTPWWAIGASVVATYIGSLTFLGGPAWAYTDGFAVIFIHINYPIAIFIVVNLFLPFFYNSGVASIFDYLEKRFGLASRTVMSAVFLFGNAAYSGIMLFTTALVLEFITGVDLVTAIMILAAVVAAYTMLGGITAVIWTDVVQSIILFLGAFITLFLLIDALPLGFWGTLQELKAIGKANPFETTLDPSRVATIWTGVVAMSIYHVVVYGVNQMMVQRTLAARTLGEAKKAYILMGYLAFWIFVLFFGLGLLFYSYYQGKSFENGNLILLDFVSSLNLTGMMGIVTAAVLASAMASLDSALNSMATVTTLDFYQKFVRRTASASHYLIASRWFTLMWAVLIVVPAIVFSRSGGSVLEVLSKVGSFLVGAKLAMFGLGFYSRRTTERGLLIGVAAGFITLWWVDSNLNIAWPWYCALGGVVSIAVAWLASVLLDGWQREWSPYSVPGQLAAHRAIGLPEKVDGWYVVAGRFDKASYGLLIYFVACIAALAIVYQLL